MNKTRAVMRYLVKNYPYKMDLTKTRLTKLVYLCDWLMAEKEGTQITPINWYFDHYGPYVSDVLDEADEDKEIKIRKTISNFGTTKYLIEQKNENDKLDYSILNEKEISIIDEIIRETESFSYNEFIDYVYNTEPIKTIEKYNKLNLVDIANQK